MLLINRGSITIVRFIMKYTRTSKYWICCFTFLFSLTGVIACGSKSDSPKASAQKQKQKGPQPSEWEQYGWEEWEEDELHHDGKHHGDAKATLCEALNPPLDPETATHAEIERAIRRRMKDLHPDKNGGTAESTAAFQEFGNLVENYRKWYQAQSENI